MGMRKTSKAFFSGWISGANAKVDAKCDGVNADKFNPYSRKDCVDAWEAGYQSGFSADFNLAILQIVD